MPLRALGGFATTMSEMLGPRETRAFGILAYHRIAAPIPGRPAPTWNVPPDRLRQQLQGLVDRGFRAWPLLNLQKLAAEGQPIPPKAFAVTFDGVYENFYLNALPILRQFNIPATVFMATAYLDSTEPFASDDWEEAGSGNVPFTAWRPISTEECREMLKCGLVEIGALAPATADIPGPAGELASDLRRERRILRERLGVEPVRVALPFRRNAEASDDTTSSLAAAAQEAGLACALVSEPRLVREGDTPFAWGRFLTDELDSAASLAAKLSGWYEAVHALGDTLLGRNKRQIAGPDAGAPAVPLEVTAPEATAAEASTPEATAPQVTAPQVIAAEAPEQK